MVAFGGDGDGDGTGSQAPPRHCHGLRGIAAKTITNAMTMRTKARMNKATTMTMAIDGATSLA